MGSVPIFSGAMGGGLRPEGAQRGRAAAGVARPNALHAPRPRRGAARWVRIHSATATPSLSALAASRAALRMRSLALRGAFLRRVIFWFESRLSSLSRRCPTVRPFGLMKDHGVYTPTGRLTRRLLRLFAPAACPKHNGSPTSRGTPRRPSRSPSPSCAMENGLSGSCRHSEAGARAPQSAFGAGGPCFSHASLKATHDIRLPNTWITPLGAWATDR